MLVADADSPSPAVHLHTLLTGWQLGDAFAVIALAVQVLALLWYLAAIRRLSRRGRRWPRLRAVAFISGILSLTIVLVSGLSSYDDSVFVVHVIQHVVIMMVAPPLLSLGAPVTLAMQAANRPTQSRIVHVVRNPVLRLLTVPLIAAVLYYGAMYVALLTSFYPYSIRHDVAHNLEHLVMFGLGCLFWWPMIAVDQLPHRPAFPSRILAMFAGMPFEVFLGVALMNFSHPIAPEHSLSDTRAGGAVFWGASMLITFAAALVMVAQWMKQEERRAARQDRQVDVGEARRVDAWEAARAAKIASSRRYPVSPNAGADKRT